MTTRAWEQPKRLPASICYAHLLRRRLPRSLPRDGFGRIKPPMKRIFDMDDRARLPWRFYGESLSILARL
ncbi:MAG: hypothetical protein ACRCS0_02930 [Albidovulum sp.]